MRVGETDHMDTTTLKAARAAAKWAARADAKIKKKLLKRARKHGLTEAEGIELAEAWKHATSPKLHLMDLWKALQGVAIKAARYFECRNSIRSWHLGLGHRHALHRLSARRMGFPHPDSSLSEAALLWQRR